MLYTVQQCNIKFLKKNSFLCLHQIKLVRAQFDHIYKATMTTSKDKNKQTNYSQQKPLTH